MENNVKDNVDERQTILAVDDEEAIIDLLKFNIEKEGYDFISASNGEEGLKKILTENPDLIILDLMLPKMDGLTVCKQARQEKLIHLLLCFLLEVKKLIKYWDLRLALTIT